MSRLAYGRPTFARVSRGFTLIEIILVVVIILTLASIVGPRLTGRARESRIRATQIQIEGIRSALQVFEINASRFPTTSEGLEALVKRPADLSEAQWPGKYMDRLPEDSFNKAFKYACPSEHGGDYDLISAGPDGQFETNDDITNRPTNDQRNL